MAHGGASCADGADAPAAFPRPRGRGRAGPDANPCAVDALLRDALLRQAELIALLVRRRAGQAAPDAGGSARGRGGRLTAWLESRPVAAVRCAGRCWGGRD
jgi:hypothetical protein